ncbi:hypothetical protein ABTQ08_21910, partial [Acinetobacter baumannii]
MPLSIFQAIDRIVNARRIVVVDFILIDFMAQPRLQGMGSGAGTYGLNQAIIAIVPSIVAIITDVETEGLGICRACDQ